MNSIVALPILAAMPTVAPAMPSGAACSGELLLRLGAEYDQVWRTFFRTDDLSDQSDELGAAISTAVAVTPAEWAIKARPVVLNHIAYWERPLDDLDWDEKMTRLFVDSIFAAAGAMTVEHYLRGLGCELKVRTKYGRPRPHADAELIALSKKYEELLALEDLPHQEYHRLQRLADRRRYERLGVDPDDQSARDLVAKERWAEWVESAAIAGAEVGRDKAFDRWNRASERTARIGRRIMKLQARTALGLKIKARVIETHDEVCKMEPDEQLIAEIKAFAAAA